MKERDFWGWYESCPSFFRKKISLAFWKALWVNALDIETFNNYLFKIQEDYPCEYLLKKAYIGPYELAIEQPLLIPRETTYDWCSSFLKNNKKQHKRILDLGSGPGTLGIILFHEYMSHELTVCDSSSLALYYSEVNLRPLYQDLLTVRLSDWFNQLDGLFDLIVSNPPYIDSMESGWMSPGTAYEDPAALISEQGGLSDIRIILDQARSFLRPEGEIVLEHGAGQGFAVDALMSFYGYKSKRFWRDHLGAWRATSAIWQSV